MMPQLASWLYRKPLYALTLTGAVPQGLSCLPPPDKSGDAARGRSILGGAFICSRHKFASARPNWFDPSADRSALATLHGFNYLADLAAVGETARTCARALVASWITSGSQWDEVSWSPEILGSRIAAWLSHAQLLSSGPNLPLERAVLDSLARQSRHLARVVTSSEAGAVRLDALRGLIYGAACGIASRRILGRAVTSLCQELDRQILADGAHVEKSPAAQYRALADLVDIREMLHTARHPVPKEIHDAIARAAPMLRFFRHGDGELALFNGATSSSAKAIDALLLRSRVKEPTPTAAADGGFQRLAAGTTLVIQDVGKPPRPGLDRAAHAGCLAFEMSDGPDRLIVNCGAAADPNGEALRTTAAHSTLVVANVNSAELIPGGLGRRPAHVEASREETHGNVWVTASHDGYRDRFGLTHRRRLYLSASGDNLRGEDTLVSTEGAPTHGFAVRFHLHPDVKASMLQNGAAVLLRTPSGRGWRFQNSGGLPHLEESIYVANDSPRRTQQIVIEAATQRGGAVVKWALQKVSDT
ncbi:MAG: heparinase II/III family protein [Alphaproteobacteria bacterium]|nr:heparinase II/III family protein [Alphaproteobacteria bacterium]